MASIVKVGENYTAKFLKRGDSGKGKFLLCQVEGIKNTTIFFDNPDLPLCDGQAFQVVAINDCSMKGDKYHHDKTGEWRLKLEVNITAKIGKPAKVYFEDVDMNAEANPFDDGQSVFGDGELPF